MTSTHSRHKPSCQCITEVQPGLVEITDGTFSWTAPDSKPDKASDEAPAKQADASSGVTSADEPESGTVQDDEKEDVEVEFSKDDRPTLRDINFKCEPGSLTMVVGAVGSGKSSLLATLFQQITLQEGSVKVGFPTFLLCAHTEH